MIKPALFMLAVVMSSQVWAVNKCTGPDGKVVFQDMPCAARGEKLHVRPASGEATPTPTPLNTSGESASAPPKTEAQRINEQVEKSRASRRLQELEQSTLPNAYNTQAQHRTSCDRQIQALRDRKALANNNLAGATWEQSLSTEMAAIATRCDTRGREIQADIDSLRKECQALGGCK